MNSLQSTSIDPVKDLIELLLSELWPVPMLEAVIEV
jgi:hypothetical protein